MTDQEAFDLIEPRLGEIDRKEVRDPDMPIDRAVHEGQVMAVLASEDEELFVVKGYDPQTTTDLNLAVATLGVAEAKMQATVGDSEAVREWKEVMPLAYDMRDTLLRDMAHYFRKNEEASKKVKKAREGGSHTNMLGDLRLFTQLGRNYSELFPENYDLSVFEENEKLAERVRMSYATAEASKPFKPAKDIRDRAFTYMRQLMSEILEMAEYVHHDNPDRLNQYYSPWRRLKSKNRAAEAVSESELETV